MYVYEDIKHWANLYKEAFVNEAIVDDAYISTAIQLLADLQKDNPQAYEQALKYLNYQKGRQLAVTPEQFAERRIQMASSSGSTSSAPVQSRADLIKSVGAKNTSDIEELKAKQQAHRTGNIASIWVKGLNIANPLNASAELEITFSDGRKSNSTFSLGSYGADDKLYKVCKRQMRASPLAAQRRLTEMDIYLSMMRVSFGDNNIKWFYGKNKANDQTWAFAEE